MNYTFETFDKNDEANNDWESLPLCELEIWCYKNYKYAYKEWKAEQDAYLMFILSSTKAELVKKNNCGKTWTKPKLQFHMIQQIDNNKSLIQNKQRIIAPPSQDIINKWDTYYAEMRQR